MKESITLNIFTASNVLTFDVLATASGFEETLANGLEEGSLILTQTDGSPLILSGLNVVAIEIKNTPPQK